MQPNGDFESHQSSFLAAHSAFEGRLPLNADGLSLDAGQDNLSTMRSSLHAMESIAAHSDDTAELSRRQRVIAEAREKLQASAQSIQSAMHPVNPLHSNSEGDFASYERRLLDAAASTERQTAGWAAAKEQIHQTESIGEEILGNLSRQRETVYLASGVTDEAHGALGQANRIMAQMRRKIRQNKFLVYVIMGALGLLILITLYLRAKQGRRYERYTEPPRGVPAKDLDPVLPEEVSGAPVEMLDAE